MGLLLKFYLNENALISIKKNELLKFSKGCYAKKAFY